MKGIADSDVAGIVVSEVLADRRGGFGIKIARFRDIGPSKSGISGCFRTVTPLAFSFNAEAQ